MDARSPQTDQTDQTVQAGRGPAWWIAPAAVGLMAVYLPTLAAPFDFVDDGCLVYSSRESWTGLPQRIWQRSVAEFETYGPFRPAAWAHWMLAAEALGVEAWRHRLARLLWGGLSAAMLLLLLRELGIRPLASLATTAAAMWNPYRNEIWLGLGLTEAFAMPYALAALWCAARAAQRPRPWVWDLAGASAAIVALLCKNTFAAIVPAQVLLRLTGDGGAVAGGVRRHGRAAFLLSLTLVVPAAHFIAYRLDPRPKVYMTTFSHEQPRRMLSSVASAAGYPYLLCGVVLAGLAGRRRKVEPIGTDDTAGLRRHSAAAGLVQGSSKVRSTVMTGLVLCAGGMAIYYPIDGVAGRYTMPAVWGVDLLLASLLNAAGQSSWRRRRLAAAGFALGLCGLLIANGGRQERTAARARLLWQALSAVEEALPAGGRVLWCGVPGVQPTHQGLGQGEGVHFHWHLQGRGRSDLNIVFAAEADSDTSAADLAVTDGSPPPQADRWRRMADFEESYWLGLRRCRVVLWQRTEAPGSVETPRLGSGLALPE